jgi:hypothetical protein
VEPDRDPPDLDDGVRVRAGASSNPMPGAAISSCTQMLPFCFLARRPMTPCEAPPTTSLTPFATRLSDSTATTIATPGGNAIHGCWFSCAVAADSMPPHDASSIPMLRKLRVDSMMIAEPSMIDACAVSGTTRLGRISLNRIAGAPRPDTFAASTNSFSRSTSVTARVMRASPMQNTIAIAITTFSSSRPRIVMTAKATSSPGRASEMSIARDPIRSHHPPLYPINRPNGTPINIANPTDPSETMRVTRVPAISWLRMSARTCRSRASAILRVPATPTRSPFRQGRTARSGRP